LSIGLETSSGSFAGEFLRDIGSIGLSFSAGPDPGLMALILAVVLGGAIVTSGGVSLFVAFFVSAPIA
jgi:hypothetical protein